MNSTKNRIVWFMAVAIMLLLFVQVLRFDHVIVRNYKNQDRMIDKELIYNPKLTEEFETDDSFLVIYDSSDKSSVSIKKNCVRMLEAHKKKYRLVDVKEPTSVYINEKTILIMVSATQHIENFNEIVDFISSGGKVGILQPIFSLNQYLKFGIVEMAGGKSVKGIKFDDRFMPAAGEDMIDLVQTENFSSMLGLNSDAEVYMESIEGIPLLWTYKYNNGKIAYFNGNMIESKSLSGFVARIIALLEGEYIYPVLANKVMWIDDFPSPMSNSYYSDIKKEYNKTIKEFYIDVWWPQMLKIAQNYNITYTGALIQTYNDNTHEPFSPVKGEISDREFIVMGRELIRSGGEMGLHGYNHQPMTLNAKSSKFFHYNVWDDAKDMISALNVADAKLKRCFPKYNINCYVPPSNIIDEHGIIALKTVFPKLNVIASVYYEDYGNISYVQDFSYNEAADVINLPRFSSGYNFGEFNRLSIYSGILGFGTIQHFIHPDDFMDPERNEGKPYKKQIKSYEKLAEFAYDNMPFIKPETASEAANTVASYIGIDYITDYGEDGITVKTNAKDLPLHMFLHSERPVVAGENCELYKFGENDYYVKYTDKNFKINYE